MTNKYFNIVLVEPQIPNNTGNIGRIAVASNSTLHLIKPLGFEITDARVKRAGLDYWQYLDIKHHENIEEWYQQVENKDRIFFFSANAISSFYNLKIEQGDTFVFGKEASGLDLETQKRFNDQLYKIPFPGKVRSFNLANAVAMVIGEGMRQMKI